MKQCKLIVLSVVLAMFGSSCKDDDKKPEISADDSMNILEQTLNLPTTLFSYRNQTFPVYYRNGPVTQQDNTLNINPITDAGATLGRVLFYDKNMSINNAIACASCHIQDKGFADPNALSTGFEGGLTGRNSMGLINARYYQTGRFFWDERAETLEAQTIMPIQDHIEMGMDLNTLEKKLSQIPYYNDLFTAAFGDDEVSSERISLALAQFVRSIVSYESKFDVGRAAFGPAPQPEDPFSNFTASENRGKEVFFSAQLGSCAACHVTESFAAPGPRNNGLDETNTDLGIGGITKNPQDEGLFKVNSLRNVELTAPYMHDGRFKTLEEVVEHYNSGVQANPNLSPPLRGQGPRPVPRRLNLSESDKTALVDFLKTLTDTEIGKKEMFSNPFQ